MLFAKHFTFTFIEGHKRRGGYILLHNRVSTIVAWFKIDEGCTSLLQNSSRPPTRRNVYLFCRTHFHKSSNILLDTVICISFAKSISSQIWRYSFCNVNICINMGFRDMLYRLKCEPEHIVSDNNFFYFCHFWPPHPFCITPSNTCMWFSLMLNLVEPHFTFS